MRSDAGVLCTSLVRDVFNVHLHKMYDEGYFDEALQNLAKWQDLLYCPIGDIGDELEEASTLDMTHLGGAFIFHSMP